MEAAQRRTVVAHSRLATRELRLTAARHRRHGLQVMTFEQLATRLAGGLLQPVDDETLRAVIQATLPVMELGELDGIKTLPGMVDVTVDTLRKAWHAGIDLQARAAGHPRLQSIARLEAAVLAALPPAMKRPADLVAAARQRLVHAPTLFGPVDIVGITELSPCWRPLLQEIAACLPVRWIAGPRSVPAWLDSHPITIVRSASEMPVVDSVSASTAYHEAIEAMRWARQLIASGTADPADIAIASVTPADYDDHFLALRADANLDLHFVHGVKVTASRDGQTVAALADILVRGLSQTRMRRLAALLGTKTGPFESFPAGWTRLLPTDAPLTTPDAWTRLLDRLTAADWPDQTDHGPALREVIALLDQGVTAAETIGETLLSGHARAIWRKALRAGPAASLDMTLEAMKQNDGLEACVAVAWMPASELAAAPRPFVRLLGLNSSRWPRSIAEDRLLSDHIIPTVELDPLPVGAADRHDFATILTTTVRQVVLSRARRDADGRLLGRSPLLQGQPAEIYLRRNAVPSHTFSETDRLLARPEEFQATPQAHAALAGWRNWQRHEITPHDGLVRADHPVLIAVANRTQSASSLRLLLRNPLGFIWKYGLGWRTPESGADPLVLDAPAFGNLVHATLDSALQMLEAGAGLHAADRDCIAAVVGSVVEDVACRWEMAQAVPPRLIWRRTLNEVRELAIWALTLGAEQLPGARAYSEIPFGGSPLKSDAALPWDATTPVRIPGVDFRIAGYIDRLDVSADGRRVRVCDYKTGLRPKTDIILKGGQELQRGLYAFAVRALLGAEVEVDASLLYLRDQTDLRLQEPQATLEAMVVYLNAARANLLAGGGTIGPDAGDEYDEFAFALPANAGAAYRKRKIAAAIERLGAAATVWEAP